MLNFNFYGYVGKDPETRATQKGDTFAKFVVGCNTLGKQQSTWINVSVNAKSKSYDYVMQYLKTGDLVYISGAPYATGYMSKKENKIKADLNVFADRVETIISKKNNENINLAQSLPEENAILNSDVPF